MNDEQLRDLTGRVVAMAPEPPPFPEEVTVATPEPARRWTAAVVVLVAAAFAIAAVAIPIILLSSGDEPSAATSSTTPTTVPPTTAPTSPTTLPGTTLPPTTLAPTTTLPEELGTVERPTVVYLTQIPENSVNGNPTLIPFVTTVVTTAEHLDEDMTAVVAASLQLLTRPDLVLPADTQNLIPEGVDVQSVSAEGDSVVVDMNERFVEGTAGLLGDITMLNQLVYTATAFGADTVRFTVNGEPIEAYGSEGMVLTDPIGRDDFLDELSLIVITGALEYDGDDLPRVSGVANVFEATVSLEIVDAGGRVVYEDFTTATCGTGCWGEFDFPLDTSALTADSTVKVFWASPEDGSQRDVVTIPVGGIWDLVPGE